MTLAATIAHSAVGALTAVDPATEASMGSGFADSFWVVAALAIALLLLGLDLTRRLRRAKNRADIQAELAPELEAMRAAEAAAAEAAAAESDGVQSAAAESQAADPAKSAEPGEVDPRS